MALALVFFNWRRQPRLDRMQYVPIYDPTSQADLREGRLPHPLRPLNGERRAGV
jgi:hypothetical protein